MTAFPPAASRISASEAMVWGGKLPAVGGCLTRQGRRLREGAEVTFPSEPVEYLPGRLPPR